MPIDFYALFVIYAVDSFVKLIEIATRRKSAFVHCSCDCRTKSPRKNPSDDVQSVFQRIFDGFFESAVKDLQETKNHPMIPEHIENTVYYFRERDQILNLIHLVKRTAKYHDVIQHNPAFKCSQLTGEPSSCSL